MGNHAGNFLTNNNYVAGLVDSDFSVMIMRRTIRGDKLRMVPRISFTNTNPFLIEFMSSYLKRYDINHYVGIRKKTKYNHKIEKQIIIQRYSKCIDFSDKIISCAVIRRPQLEIIRDFCVDRCKYMENYGWKFINTPYTDYQKKLCNEIINLNLDYNFDNNFRNHTFSWLGGFIDGDGSIGMSYHKQGGDRTDYKITPFINFSLGSDSGFNNVKELLNKSEIGYSCTAHKCKASRKLGRNKKKHYYLVAIKSHNDLRKIIPKLNGKLIAKQQQLNLLFEYLDIRNNEKGPYSDRCYEIVSKVKNLNNNYS